MRWIHNNSSKEQVIGNNKKLKKKTMLIGQLEMVYKKNSRAGHAIVF